MTLGEFIPLTFLTKRRKAGLCSALENELQG